MLSISEEAFSNIHHNLQLDPAFVNVKSLANQTVAIRTKAIADLYLSSEAYDDYGPEHSTYSKHALILYPILAIGKSLKRSNITLAWRTSILWMCNAFNAGS